MFESTCTLLNAARDCIVPFSAQIELNATELRLQHLLKAETIKCCGGANLNLTLRNACTQTQKTHNLRHALTDRRLFQLHINP